MKISLEKYIDIILKNSLISFSALFIFLLSLYPGISNFQLDASSDSLVLENDPDLKTYREMGNLFSDSDFLIVTLRPNEDIFNKKSLQRIERIENEILEIDGVNQVLSILDAPIVEQPKVSLSEIGDNIKYLLDEGIDLQKAKQEILSNPIYQELIVSKDGSTTAFQILLDENENYENLIQQRYDLLNSDKPNILFDVNRKIDEQNSLIQEKEKRIVAEIRSVINSNRDFGLLFLGGPAMIANDMIDFIKSDLSIFGLLVFLIFGFLLYFFFRDIKLAFIPLINAALVIYTTSSILGYADWKISVVSSNFIALLLILTISISVHVIERFVELKKEDHDERLVNETFSQMFIPCFFAVLTTGVAFLSLISGDIKPVLEFGKMMTVGIIVVFIFTFTFVPLAFHNLGFGPLRASSKIGSLPTKIGKNIITNKTIIILASIFLGLLFIIGVNNLKVENKFIDYFKKNTEIYQGMSELDEKLGGTATLDIIIYEPDNYLADDDEISDEFDDLFDEDIFEDDNSESSGFWWNIYNLKRLEEIHDYLDDNENIGKVLSVSSGIKLARKINDNNELNDLELALLRSVLPEDIKDTVLNSYISSDDSIVRISTRVYESSESLNRDLLLKKINSDLQEKFGISSDKYKITGLAVLYNNMLQSLFSSMLNSIIIVYTVIALMLLILFRSVKIMLAGLLPNILIGIGVLGTMGLLRIPLDIMTITVASISVGIAVDNTIHYLYKFKSEYELNKDFNEAMIGSHSTIGRAIFYTASTISIGFLIFSFSNFIPTIYFGIFTALAMFFAFLVSLTLLPILLEKMRAFE